MLYICIGDSLLTTEAFEFQPYSFLFISEYVKGRIQGLLHGGQTLTYTSNPPYLFLDELDSKAYVCY